MKRGPIALPLILLLSASLGGCLGGDAPTIRAAPLPVEVPEDYGSINGTVIDEELVGVPQVRVELNPTDLWTITDQQGRFRFNYVAPGVYELDARLFDLGSFTQRLTVQAGSESPVTMYVTFPPVTRPYNATMIFQGYFGCHADGYRCPVYPSANDKTTFAVPVAPNLTAVLIELYWRPPPYTDVTSVLRVNASYQGHNLHIDSHHRAPYMRVEFGPGWFKKADGGTVYVYLVSQHTEINYYDPGVFYEQKVDVYVTTFYLEDRMKGFSAVPDR